jgi:hypothetical protein
MSESRDPSLSEIITDAFEYMASSLRVSMPCRVVAVDQVKHTVDCKPTVLQRIPNGDGVEETIELPVIPDVPIAFPRFGDWFIRAPLAVGDIVLCLFSDTSMDTFRAQATAVTTPVDPMDTRRHHISDAIALPMNVYGDDRTVGVVPGHLVIGKKDGTVSFHLKADEVCLGSENPGDRVALGDPVKNNLTEIRDMFSWISADLAAIAATVPIAVTTPVKLANLLGAGFPFDVKSPTVRSD